MCINDLKKYIAQESISASARDYKVALILALLITLRSVFNIAYYSGFSDRLAIQGIPTDLTNMLVVIHICIAGCCILYTIGLWSRRVIGWLLSLFSILCLYIVYGWWYLEKFDYLSDLREGTALYNQYYQNIGLFRGATKWDIVVLVISLTITLWQLSAFIKICRSFRGFRARQGLVD